MRVYVQPHVMTSTFCSAISVIMSVPHVNLMLLEYNFNASGYFMRSCWQWQVQCTTPFFYGTMTTINKVDVPFANFIIITNIPAAQCKQIHNLWRHYQIL